jgi:hypothetical protein
LVSDATRCALVATGRRLKLRFSRLCPGFRAFQQVYYQLAFG